MSVCVHIFMHEHTGPFPPMNSVHGRREGFWRREFCLESPRMLRLLPPGRVSVWLRCSYVRSLLKISHLSRLFSTFNSLTGSYPAQAEIIGSHPVWPLKTPSSFIICSRQCTVRTCVNLPCIIYIKCPVCVGCNNCTRVHTPARGSFGMFKMRTACWARGLQAVGLLQIWQGLLNMQCFLCVSPPSWPLFRFL